MYDKPFDFLYIIDKPEKFTVKDIRSATSAGLYLQLFSSIFKEQAGDYDNYTQHQRFLVPHDFEPKGIPGFTSFYGSFGSAVLHVPADSLVNYCSSAAAINILRGQYFSRPPSDDIYAEAHQGTGFYTVPRGKDSSSQIHIKDFSPEKSARRGQMNNLFRKRIHLLAKCEYSDNVDNLLGKPFCNIFKHGNALGTIPDRVFGQQQGTNPAIQTQMQTLYAKETKKANFSIYQSIIDSIGSGDEGAPILDSAFGELESFLKAKKPDEGDPQLTAELYLRKSEV